MNPFLLFPDRDFNPETTPGPQAEALIADLNLEIILSRMAGRDKVVYNTCKSVLLNPLQSPEDIRFRQINLGAALRKPALVRQLYEISIDTERRRRGTWFWRTSANVSGFYIGTVKLLKVYGGMLAVLRQVANTELESFGPSGFQDFLSLLRRELADTSFLTLLDELDQEGLLISATLGSHLQGVDYVLRQKNPRGFWRRWRFAPSYTLLPRDDGGAIDLRLRRDRALNEATNALAQACDHLESFFAGLRRELAFYVGCLNLADCLESLGLPVCIPQLLSYPDRRHSWQSLYDVGLALTKGEKVVGNELPPTEKDLFLITGANQGGKTTFLRSIGQAQLMAQCGLFVGGDAYTAPVYSGIFTHFTRAEDKTMSRGKLDEELARFSDLIDGLNRGGLVLLNEFLAATNEREGSELCRQITQALIENGVQVFSVSHFYTYAVSFLGEKNTQFLRAQRFEDGQRTFKITPGEPLSTAYGEDVYRQLFG